MTGFGDFDSLQSVRFARWRVVIARDNEAGKRRVCGPERFHRLRHRAGRLACTDHYGPADRWGWQERRGVAGRQGARDGRIEQGPKEAAGIDQRGAFGV